MGGEGHVPVGDDSLGVESRRVGDAVVVSLSGELDMLTAPQLFPAVERCLADSDCRVLVVDLTDVTFLGSSGLKALLDVRDLARERGLLFRLAAASRQIIRTLEMTGLEKALPQSGSVDDAVGGTATPGSMG